MAKSIKKDKKQELIDQHYELSMSIALQAIRIHEMQKVLAKQSDEILTIEAKLEKLEAEKNGQGLN